MRGMRSVLNASVCACVCLCVGERVWTSQRYCWRFSARPLGRRAEGCKVIFEGAGEASAPTVTVSVSCLPEPGLRDRWDAFVWLGRGHEARQTGAFVRPLCVGALPVLTQGHLVADVLALVYVCRRRRRDELVSREISQLKQLPAPHLLLSNSYF